MTNSSNAAEYTAMLTGVLPFMEDIDMTKSQIAAVKKRNINVVLRLKIWAISTER